MGDGRRDRPALPPRIVEADDERVLADRPVRKGAWARFRGVPAGSRLVPAIDHPWDASGATRTQRQRILGRLRVFRSLAGIAVAALLIAFVVAGAVTPVVGLLVGALPVSWLLVVVLRLRTFGPTTVAFLEFPYLAVGPLRLQFSVGVGGGRFHEMRIDLECLTERLVPLPIGRWTRCLRLHGDTQLRRQGDLLPEPGSGIEIEFEIPSGLPGTHLSAPFPTYWQLRVRGPTTAGAYDETFLLPVYEEWGTLLTPSGATREEENPS